MKYRLKKSNLKKKGQLANETNQRKTMSHFVKEDYVHEAKDIFVRRTNPDDGIGTKRYSISSTTSVFYCGTNTNTNKTEPIRNNKEKAN